MKLIDLSTPFDMKFSIPQLPETESIMDFNPVNTKIKSGFAETQFTITTHSGTHIDAPAHWFTRQEKSGIYSVEDIPLEWLYGETVVLDMPRGELEPIGPGDFENAAIEIKKDDIVLVNTGWGRYFEGDPKNSWYLSRKQPGLTLDGAKWLVEKKVRAYGQDTLEVQHPSHSFFPDEKAREAGIKSVLEPVHRLLLGNDIVLIEHLANLDKVANRRIVAGFFPVLIIKSADGTPIRAVAFIDD